MAQIDYNLVHAIDFYFVDENSYINWIETENKLNVWRWAYST